jgi:predicted RecA/RadA family phage recombinase
MKAPSHHLHSEHLDDSAHLAGPCAAVFVALAGAAVVVGAMLLVSVSELNAGRFVPDFAALQSLIIG